MNLAFLPPGNGPDLPGSLRAEPRLSRWLRLRRLRIQRNSTPLRNVRSVRPFVGTAW